MGRMGLDPLDDVCNFAHSAAPGSMRLNAYTSCNYYLRARAKRRARLRCANLCAAAGPTLASGAHGRHSLAERLNLLLWARPHDYSGTDTSQRTRIPNRSLLRS